MQVWEPKETPSTEAPWPASRLRHPNDQDPGGASAEASQTLHDSTVKLALTIRPRIAPTSAYQGRNYFIRRSVYSDP
jgi:hypothetical protein